MATERNDSPPRDTRQKRAIRRAFEKANRPLTPEQVLATAAGESRGLGLATVYRSIRAMIDAGALTAIDVPGHGAFYELAGKEHHHHFACEACGDVFEIPGCAPDLPVRLPRGFRARSHDITVFGRCNACVPGRSAQRA